MAEVILTRNQVEVLFNEVQRFHLEDQPAEFERGLTLSGDDIEARIQHDDEGDVFVAIEVL